MRDRARQMVLTAMCCAVVSAHARQLPSIAAPGSDAARAEESLRANDGMETLARYRALVAAHPDDEQALTALGVLLYGEHQPAEAAGVLTHALQVNPLAPRAALFLALSQAALGQCERATPVLARQFAGEPTGRLQRLTGLTLLGCSLQAEDATPALPVVAALRQNYPNDADVLYESAELYTHLWTNTAKDLMTAHPESYRVHQLAGEVNEAQGHLEQAVRQYRAALAEDRRLPEMHYKIGQLLLRLGAADADDRAMEEFRAELAIGPSARSALAMGEIDRHLGRLDAAMSEYTVALKIDPAEAAARVGLAQVLLAQHRTADAEAELRPLLAEQPENAQAHYAMMLAYRADGKQPEAAAEMALFQQQRQASAEQFQHQLDALLSGESQAGAGSKAGGESKAGPSAAPGVSPR